MDDTKKTPEKVEQPDKTTRRRVRKIQFPAREGRFKRSIIEKAVEEVIAERS